MLERCPLCHNVTNKPCCSTCPVQSKEPNKMTRGEAYKIWNTRNSMIDALEALGLLKFDNVCERDDCSTTAKIGKPICSRDVCPPKLQGEVDYPSVEKRLNCKLNKCNNPSACSAHNNCGAVLKPTSDEIIESVLRHPHTTLQAKYNIIDALKQHGYTIVDEDLYTVDMKYKIQKRPVAWRVGPLSNGDFCITASEEQANAIAGDKLKVQGLYLRDGT